MTSHQKLLKLVSKEMKNLGFDVEENAVVYPWLKARALVGRKDGLTVLVDPEASEAPSGCVSMEAVHRTEGMARLYAGDHAGEVVGLLVSPDRFSGTAHIYAEAADPKVFLASPEEIGQKLGQALAERGSDSPSGNSVSTTLPEVNEMPDTLKVKVPEVDSHGRTLRERAELVVEVHDTLVANTETFSADGLAPSEEGLAVDLVYLYAAILKGGQVEWDEETAHGASQAYEGTPEEIAAHNTLLTFWSLFEFDGHPVWDYVKIVPMEV